MSAALPFRPASAVLARGVLLAGSCTTAADGSIASQSGTGITWTVTGTGEYTGTFHTPFQSTPIAMAKINTTITRVDVTVSTTAVVVTNNPSGTPTALNAGTVVAMVLGETL